MRMQCIVTRFKSLYWQSMTEFATCHLSFRTCDCASATRASTGVCLQAPRPARADGTHPAKLRIALVHITRRFTFISAYSVIAQLRPNDAATHTALFLICRRVPYLLLFPVTGLAADRLNRGALLVAVCLAEGAVSFTLPLVQQQQNIW